MIVLKHIISIARNDGRLQVQSLARVYQLSRKRGQGVYHEKEIHTYDEYRDARQDPRACEGPVSVFRCSRGWHIPMSRTSPPTACKLSLTVTYGLSPEEEDQHRIEYPSVGRSPKRL